MLRPPPQLQSVDTVAKSTRKKIRARSEREAVELSRVEFFLDEWVSRDFSFRSLLFCVWHENVI